MQDEGSLDSSSLWCFCLLAESYETINHYHYLKAFQNKSQFGCFCMLKKLKGWNLKTWTWTNSGYQLPSIFLKGENVKLSKGLTLWFLDGECSEMGRESKQVGAMPICYCLTFVCCQPCLSNFQCFQSFVSWAPFCIFSSCYVVSGTDPSVAVS